MASYKPLVGPTSGMRARYDSGDCSRCNRPILAGQFFSWARRGNNVGTNAGKWHVNCADPSLPPASAMPTQYTPTPAPVITHYTPDTDTALANNTTPTPADNSALTNALKHVAATLGEHAEGIGTIATAMQTLRTEVAAADAKHTAHANETNELIADLQKQVTDLRPVVVNLIKNNIETHIDVGVQHFNFTRLLKLAAHLSPNANIWISGPAGSGKSTAAEQIAKILGVPFFFNGIVSSEYKLLGNNDANGNFVETPLYKAWSQPSVYLADEIDAWDPRATMALNNPLATGWCDFANGCIKRHPECIIIAGANTWGFGGDANYVGRTKMDATSKNRFVSLSWPYDEKLERMLVGTTDSDHVNAKLDVWVNLVQATRAEAFRLGIQVTISPRQSIAGAKLIRSGQFTNEEVVDACFGDIRGRDEWLQLGKLMEAFAKQGTTADVPTSVPTVNLSGTRI